MLLLEAGATRAQPWVSIPAGFGKLLQHPAYNWRFETEPEEATSGRVIVVPRGQGSRRLDADQRHDLRARPAGGLRFLGAAGSRGWGSADVLPYFRKLEDFEAAPDPLRGARRTAAAHRGGRASRIAEAFIASAQAAGYPRNPDYNAATRTASAITRSTREAVDGSALPTPT